MGWIDEYITHQHKKTRATESKRRYVQMLDDERVGRQAWEAQTAAALNPVTTEVKKAQDVLHEFSDQTRQSLSELKNTLSLSELKNMLDQIHQTLKLNKLDLSQQDLSESLNLSDLRDKLDQFYLAVKGNEVEQMASTPPSASASASTTIFDIKSGADVLKKYMLPHPSAFGQYEIRQIIGTVTNISKTLGGKKAYSKGEVRKGIDEELSILKKYKDLLNQAMSTNSPTVGTGAVMYYKHPDELKNRMRVLFGEMRAGNTAADVQNEAIALVDKLYEEGVISASHKQQLYEKAYSF